MKKSVSTQSSGKSSGKSSGIRYQLVIGSLIGAACIQVAYVACGNGNGTPDAGAQSTDLTTRVTTLESEVMALQARPTIGKYCGATTTAVNGAIGTAANRDGYKQAQTACAQVAACGATARMCSAAEMAYSAQLGVAPTTGSFWLSSGLYVLGSQVLSDCAGWQNSTSSTLGIGWNGNSQQAFTTTCDMSNVIACCN